MPIYYYPAPECELQKFQNLITMTLPVNFISLENIKRREDLAQSVFVGRVQSRILGKHSLKGQYYRLVLTSLNPNEPNEKTVLDASESKIVAYIYHVFDDSIKIRDGDFVAVSNADVVPAPSYCTTTKHTHEIVCEGINTADDLSKPFVWIMTVHNYAAPGSSLDDEVKFPSSNSGGTCPRLMSKRSTSTSDQSDEIPSKRTRFNSTASDAPSNTSKTGNSGRAIDIRKLIEMKLQSKIDTGEINVSQTKPTDFREGCLPNENNISADRLKNWVCVLNNNQKSTDNAKKLPGNSENPRLDNDDEATCDRKINSDNIDDDTSSQATQTINRNNGVYSSMNVNGVQSVTRSSSMVNTLSSTESEHKIKNRLSVTPKDKLPFRRLCTNPRMLLPLSTVREAMALQPGSKARIRVKAIGMFPQLRDEEVPLCIMRCPACSYREPYRGFNVFVGEVPCPQCSLKAFMQRFFSIQLKLVDRTGDLTANVTGTDAGQFFGVTPKEYFTNNRHRTIVRNVLYLIYKDTQCKNYLECRNSWLDLIVMVVQTGLEKQYNIVDTNCELCS